MTDAPEPSGEPRRVPVVLQVATVTVVTAAVLGAVVTVFLVRLSEDPWTLARALRQWGVWSAVSLPVAFVFGAVAFVIGRSVWRGRADRRVGE